MDALHQFEISILRFINENFSNSFLDMFMPIVTALGDGGTFFIAIAIVLIIIPKTRKTGIMMALALVIGLIVCNITLKPLVARPRPYTLYTEIELLVKELSDFSFPSGHTTAAFESATVLLLTHRKWGIAALILAIIIAFSRLYLFVHFPTDVLGGMLVGIGSGCLSVYIVNRLYDLLHIMAKEHFRKRG